MRVRDANADKVIAASRAAFQKAADSYKDGSPATAAAWWTLHNAALAYVSALATDGADAQNFNKDDRPKWLAFMRVNGHAIAGALLELHEDAPPPATRKVPRSRKVRV